MTRDRVKHVTLAALALAAIACPTLAQDRARERIAALSSPDAVARAMAACELGQMPAADVRLARGALLALIGDDTAVEPKLCRNWGNWRGSDEQPSSPGREAAMALEELGTEALPELTELLQDSRPAAREQAAFALGLIESERSIEPLARVLGDTEAQVRLRAAWGLGMIEGARGVEPLLGVLGDDPDWRVREQAAWALGMIESASAAEAIASALERETDAKVRRQLVWALGRVIDSADLDLEPSALAALLRKALLEQ